jgi:alkanesulfonate monooxygenase SsuD/methylene tetrahydromethanopterin reductase-like flavin-dependent oxidoreductase (luciferase family)
MKFGLWDHFDRGDRPFNKAIDERLAFLIAGDEAGFHAFHVAEHHATPLNLVPVPGIYLGAVARLTQRMRLGPLCYLLPLYSPLRLIEEVAILDNMSDGRLDIGVGRGVSPFELNFHNVDPETSREVFLEALDVLVEGMTKDRLSHQGKRFTYKDVPIEVRCLQKPHPPIWYPSSNAEGSAFAGERGYNFMTLGSRTLARKNIEAFKAAFAKRGSAQVPSPHFPDGAAIGVNRHMVIADTDADALAIARPAHEKFHASLTKLWRENHATTPVARASIARVEDAMAEGAVIVGSPETVAREVQRQVDELGINYMTLGMFFGDMTYEHAMRTQSLFAKEVMPRIRPAPPMPAAAE